MGYIGDNLILRGARTAFFHRTGICWSDTNSLKKAINQAAKKAEIQHRTCSRKRTIHVLYPSGPGLFQGPFCCSYRRLNIDFQGAYTFQTCPVRLHARFVCKDQEDAVFCIPHLTLYYLKGGYTAMNQYELIIMLTVLGVGVCVIILIFLLGLWGSSRPIAAFQQGTWKARLAWRGRFVPAGGRMILLFSPGMRSKLSINFKSFFFFESPFNKDSRFRPS